MSFVCLFGVSACLSAYTYLCVCVFVCLCVCVFVCVYGVKRERERERVNCSSSDMVLSEMRSKSQMSTRPNSRFPSSLSSIILTSSFNYNPTNI